MRLQKASHKAIKYACLNFHYAKSVPVNVFGYSVFNDKKEWCGVVVYGFGANFNMSKQFNLSQGQVIELVRVSLNGKQESTSKVLSISFSLLKKDLPLLKLLISYADLDQNHFGIIYQATNWFFISKSMINKKDGSFIIKGKKVHGKTASDKCKKYNIPRTLENVKKVFRTHDVYEYITKGKIKYIYPISKDMIPLCKELSKPYPKKNAHEV